MPALYRIPFDHDPDWNIVGKANWDDPGTDIHPYYAYDFGLPEGHPIRAARSGTVIDSASDRANGSTAGAQGGNFVYIRHFDGTVASYAHLRMGSVLVQPGQWVHQGQLIGEAGDTGPVAKAEWHLHFQVMLFAESETTIGPSVPVVFHDAGHDAWRPTTGEVLKSNNTVLRQENWRWCKKCQGLFFGGAGLPSGPIGKCPADGGGHDASQSDCYSLAQSPTMTKAPAKTQGKWRWCKKCQGLFYGGNQGSKCFGGPPHDGSASGEYFISFSSAVTPGQKNWRWCSACQGLFFGGASFSHCPAASGGAHDDAGSGDYTLQQVMELNFAQTNWRWCSKCQSLFFGGNTGSVCPKDKQEHDRFSGNPYTLLLEPAPVAGQTGWRWCNKCQAIFFSGNTGSVCPAGRPGSAHNGDGSGHYLLHLNMPNAPGQDTWRWCQNCQGLFFAFNGKTWCPAGGDHVMTGSGTYTLGG